MKFWFLLLIFCVLLAAITGCTLSSPEKPFILIYGPASFDAWLYGQLKFYAYVWVKKGVNINNVSLFIDNHLLGIDTEMERISNSSTDFEGKDYPSHIWDSTLDSQGVHKIIAIAQTSSGELRVEKEIKIRSYLTNIWLERPSSSNNTIQVSIEKCDAGTTIPVSDGQVSANGENLNWDDVAKKYIVHQGTMIPGLDPGNLMAITYRIPGESEFTESLTIREPICNFHTTTDVNQWINGEVNNLHLIWESKNDYLNDINLHILCYDSEMNNLGYIANEMPEISTYQTECYLSRAVFPTETKYVELYLTYQLLKVTSYYFPTTDALTKTGYFLLLQDTDEIKNF